MWDFNRTGGLLSSEITSFKEPKQPERGETEQNCSYKMSCMQLEQILILKQGVKVMGVGEQTWIQ